MKDIEKKIEEFDEEKAAKVNWTAPWSKKYPVLATYQEEVDVKKYAGELRDMLTELQANHGYSEQDSMLVLKDILYHEWKGDR